MKASYVLVALTALAATGVNAECANACSGHGTCGARDACSCYKLWMGNDCSLRVCPFAHAFVDTPKGDLDMSGGMLSDSEDVVAMGDEVYPEGTTEQYPDADSNEGHFYMECSNKGLCNRKTGECDCFDGYEGTACARTVCPNSCSGHGTCETIQELAEMGTFDTTAVHSASTTTFSYSYNLWDHEKTVGCKCDEQFFGADCSQRKCKYGVDPLFESEGKRIAAEFNVYSSGGEGGLAGSFKLKMYDVFGEDYVTRDIAFDASADDFCQAIDELPNGVFDMDRSAQATLGTQQAFIENDEYYYKCDSAGLHTEACCNKNGDGDWTVYLYNNPGSIRAPEFFTNTKDKYTFVDRRVSHTSFSPGEFVNRFGHKLDLSSQLLDTRTLPVEDCGGTTLTMAETDLADTAVSALAPNFPALMKIEHEVFVVTDYDGGEFTLDNEFASQPGIIDNTNVLGGNFVFFSNAVLTVVGTDVDVVPARGWNIFVFTSTVEDDLMKGSQFVYNDLLFTVNSVSADGLTVKTVENYAGDGASSSNLAYKVVWEAADNTDFEYVSQCSNRGTCDYQAGICSCFSGYSNDNCDTQNAYAQ